MKITSAKFKEGESIPSLYTFEGLDWNPPVEFHEVPKEAKSLVLIMEDPDVPREIRPDGLWVHWIVYNMDPTCQGIPEHSAPPGHHGKGTNERTAYMGPAPPDREHRYFFTLYALDIASDWEKGMTKDEVVKAMEDHIIEKAQLMGKYELKKKS
ncbi:MAG: putative lipoprotein LppC [Chlamydiae bacterium]|nr:putative lipoprotein LppC [Chlamydiota bacterium]